MSNDKNNRPPIQRVNFFDGMVPTNLDFQAEQNSNLEHTADIVNDFHGSGVLQKNPIVLPPILDTYHPNTTNISFNVINAGQFDGKGIFVDRQPIDNIYGDQLLITMDNVLIPLYNPTKIIIFGKIYDPDFPAGVPVLETLTFNHPGSKATYNYYKSVIAVFFNNFSGGIGRTDTLATAQTSLNVGNGGNKSHVVIQEVGPLQVLDNGLVLSQTSVPNLDVRDFITSTITRTFNDELTAVVNSAQNVNYVPVSLTDLNQLPLNAGGIVTRPFLDNTNNGYIYGQKVLLTTNNLQQVSFALSLENDAYGWSGELVIGIRPLQTKSINQFANKVDLDPDVNILFEASYTQTDLFNSGYVLTTIPQEIKFNFIGSAITQPNNLIVPNQYYVITLTRRADLSTGKIFIEAGPKALINSKFTVFNPITKAWTDDTQTDLWFKLYAAAIRVSSGIAYTTSGTMVSLQKTIIDQTGKIVSAIAGPYSLAIVDANGSDNIVVLEETQDFEKPSNSPRTGNLVFLRVIDKVTINVFNTTDFNNLVLTTGTQPIVLGVVNDLNSKSNVTYSGIITLPGQVRKDTIILFNTNMNNQLLEINNVIIPNTASVGIKYRIVHAETVTQYLGDFNNDKIFTIDDLVKQAIIQDTFSAQSTNTITGTSFNPYSILDLRSRDALGFGKETVEDFVLADLDDSLIIDSTDVARLQYLTTTLPAFVTPSPTSITIQTLTVENMTNKNASILISQITGADGYAHVVSPNQVSFTASSSSDIRALSIGDSVELFTDGYFITPSYTTIISEFVQRNDLIIETRFLSNVLPTLESSYVLTFYSQNPVFNGKLGVFGEVATEVLEFVAPGIDLIAANMLSGDKVQITFDALGTPRNGLYTISQIIDAVTFRVFTPPVAITSGVANANMEFFAADGITDKISNTAVVEFVVNGINLLTSGIESGDRVHITGDTAFTSRNGAYTIARVLNATTFTIVPPALVAETGNATFEFRDSADLIVKIAPTLVIGAITQNGPTPRPISNLESAAPAVLPNGIDTLFAFSLTHVPITGTVNVHWINGGIAQTMVFGATPVQITGDGNPNDSSINRITGAIILDTFLPPDSGTSITIDYRIAPIVTLKHCYPTVVNVVSALQTDIEFRVPFINPLPNTDINGIAGAPYVIIQTNNADPPNIVLDGSNNVVAGAVMVNTINPSQSIILPALNVVLKVTALDGSTPSITTGQYWMRIFSGSRVNLPAVQKEFVADSLSPSSPKFWQIQKNNFEWAPSNMIITDQRRFLPAAFVSSIANTTYGTKNEMWVPSDLYIGAGEIIGQDGKPYHGDLEITTITIDLPVTAILSNSINIYNNLIASYAPTPGITRGGRPALKFSDGTYVGADDLNVDTALSRNQVRMNVSIGSLYLDGYKVTGSTTYQDLDQVITQLRYEIRAGTFLDHNSGILDFHIENIKAIITSEPILQTTFCRISIDVALKKAGFANPVISVSTADVLRLFTNPVNIVPALRYSISGQIVAGFTSGFTSTGNPDG